MNPDLWRLVRDLADALEWCGGSPSFAPDGVARVGWCRMVVPVPKEARATLAASTPDADPDDEPEDGLFEAGV